MVSSYTQLLAKRTSASSIRCRRIHWICGDVQRACRGDPGPVAFAGRDNKIDLAASEPEALDHA